jgi:MFS family permease
MTVNKIVKILIVADFAINSAFGLLAPIFAIFLANNIHGGGAQVAGFATSVYWITKSLLQLPIAKFLDRTDGERDDFYALVIGQYIACSTFFLYLFASEPWHIYSIQAILGVAMAFVVPAWFGIFSRHIDRGKNSFEWSLESVFSVGIATATAGAIGGTVAESFGFNVLFVSAGIISFIGVTFLIFLYPHLHKEAEVIQITLADVKARQKIIH